MNNYELLKEKCEKLAILDFSQNKKCDSARYNARKGSAFDTLYTKSYEKLRKEHDL